MIGKMETTQVNKVRPEKKAAVESLVGKLKSAKSVFLTDYSGLSVEAITDLRRSLRNAEVEYLVSKNTLTRIAAKDVGVDEIVPHLQGPTALAFGMGDPAAPAKVITEFLKKNEKPQIKSFVFEGKFFEGDKAEAIAKMPGRNQILGQLASTLAAPITGLAGALQGILRNFAYALNAVADKKRESNSEV